MAFKDPERKRQYDNALRKKQYAESPRIKNRIYYAFVKRTYGLTREVYDAMYARGCWLCGESFVEGPRPHVDHNHETNEVRGLAHGSCNLIIGHAKDCATLLRRIASALEARCLKIGIIK